VNLSELRSPAGSNKKRKRVGRGIGSGHGKTSTRGHKGQKARSGGGVRLGFEGGQMPLQRRLPKRGFNNIFRKEYTIINVKDLNRFEDGTEVTPELLLQVGLIKSLKEQVKVLGDGELEKQLVLKVHKVSGQAQDKVAAKGGKVEVM
jgi:large subunit ribosomal protein L15